jgi:hypothetical protein
MIKILSISRLNVFDKMFSSFRNGEDHNSSEVVNVAFSCNDRDVGSKQTSKNRFLLDG